MILRCTQRLLKASGISHTLDPPPPDIALGEWYANIVPLPLPGRVVVMYTSARTLLTVVAPGRSLRTTLPVFCSRLPALLERLKLPDEWIEGQLSALDPIYFARTDNRRVLGSMNDFAYAIQLWAAEARSFARFDLDAMEMRLAETPMSFLEYESPDLIAHGLALGKPPKELHGEPIMELRRRSTERRQDPHTSVPRDEIERPLG